MRTRAWVVGVMWVWSLGACAAPSPSAETAPAGDERVAQAPAGGSEGAAGAEMGIQAERLSGARMEISGMSCQSCVNGITRIVRELEGVSSVEVTLEPPRADVRFDPARVSEDQIKAAIEAAGYQVLSVEALAW